MKKLIFTLALISASIAASAGFFALDDPTYRESVCASTAQDLAQFKAEKYWLDANTKVGNYSPERRQEWVEHYAVTVALIESWQGEFDANCKK